MPLRETTSKLLGEEKVVVALDFGYPLWDRIRVMVLLGRTVILSKMRNMGDRKVSKSQSAVKFSEMAEDRQPGFLREFWGFLRQNKKWWLTPILIVLFLLIVLVIVSQTPLAPFIYPFF